MVTVPHIGAFQSTPIPDQDTLWHCAPKHAALKAAQLSAASCLALLMPALDVLW